MQYLLAGPKSTRYTSLTSWPVHREVITVNEGSVVDVVDTIKCVACQQQHDLHPEGRADNVLNIPPHWEPVDPSLGRCTQSQRTCGILIAPNNRRHHYLPYINCGCWVCCNSSFTVTSSPLLTLDRVNVSEQPTANLTCQAVLGATAYIEINPIDTLSAVKRTSSSFITLFHLHFELKLQSAKQCLKHF